MNKSITLDANGRLDVSIDTVSALIRDQFPAWSDLEIAAVQPGGWDNRTFRLGDDMLIRLPSAERYVPAVEREHAWLPLLASHLSIPIPTPIAKGNPSDKYPWNWSVYNWIKGQTADKLDQRSLPEFARDVADFLLELQSIDIAGAPVAGAPSYRGCSPKAYDVDTRTYISNLKDLIDADDALSVWEDAIQTEWINDPVWVHADLSPQNILVQNEKLHAVIDFEGVCVGDPSCDLVLAWTLLDTKSRTIFKERLSLDDDTWSRARGWCLWKALFSLNNSEDKGNDEALKRKIIIEEILCEFNELA